MATLKNAGTAFASFNPISSALANLPNGAGTIVAMVKKDVGNVGCDASGLVVGAGPSDWYHAMIFGGSSLSDDDGLVSGLAETPTWAPTTDWYIIVLSWPSGGAALNRYHHVDQSTPAGWTHSNGIGNNGGNRAGPSTANGIFRIGHFGDNSGAIAIALVGVWAGTQLSDSQCAELSVNNKTSDWWNCTGGQPTLLVECNTTTPTDIGASASTFSSIGSLTLAGADPTWTFDGRGPQAASPIDADVRKFPKVIMRSL